MQVVSEILEISGEFSWGYLVLFRQCLDKYEAQGFVLDNQVNSSVKLSPLITDHPCRVTGSYEADEWEPERSLEKFFLVSLWLAQENSLEDIGAWKSSTSKWEGGPLAFGSPGHHQWLMVMWKKYLLWHQRLKCTSGKKGKQCIKHFLPSGGISSETHKQGMLRSDSNLLLTAHLMLLRRKCHCYLWRWR